MDSMTEHSSRSASCLCCNRYSRVSRVFGGRRYVRGGCYFRAQCGGGSLRGGLDSSRH